MAETETSWQIQARDRRWTALLGCSKAHADSWEPITVEHPDKTSIVHRGTVDELYVYRPFHYANLDDAVKAFEKWLGIEADLPNLMGRMCTGSYANFLDRYEVRFVQVGPTVAYYEGHKSKQQKTIPFTPDQVTVERR